MKLGKIYEEVEKGNTYAYGCVMLYLEVDKDWWSKLQSTIEDKYLYLGTEEDPGYGREVNPHVTVLYGIHSDVPDADVEALISKLTAPEITLDTIGMFDNADKGFDVVKFNIESEDLTEMNKEFKTLPFTSDYPDYHAHATIAYVKSGKGDRFCKVLSEGLAQILKPHKIVYSKPDGSKKEYEFSS